MTGHLGDVMKESARIALTVGRNFIKENDMEIISLRQLTKMVQVLEL